MKKIHIAKFSCQFIQDQIQGHYFIKDLESAEFAAILSDTLNNIKLYPILVRYFNVTKGIWIDYNCLFEEIRKLNIYLSSEKLVEWENEHVEVDKRWVEIFNHFKNAHIPYENLLLLVQFTASITANFYIHCAALAPMQHLKGYFHLLMIFGQLKNQD
ncbi:hypothetical protein J437_LFUL003274 [Ladona fulva]|uniref:Uncharacterized protein n=1 Tax=Ladona fulva TaxID=123851 RepID=A0A8K0K0P1_LADFU|nr:hypothetical protein J437_LFUL003274 [Ladona fulva]